MAETTNNHDLPFAKELFEAADRLRGSVESAEYKHLVLELLFLKYISDAFERRRAALDAATHDRTSDYFTAQETEREEILEDRDEYIAENVFWVPTAARFDALLKAASACCYFAALRASEALALRWADVSLETATINVRAGKTKASVNTVPIPLPLLGILRAHRDAQASKGIHWISEDALVFPTSTGAPQSRRNALRAVNVASKAVGLWSEEDGREPVGLHDLRHSAANYYFSAGWKTRDVSRLLRHANPVVTQTVYGGLAPKEEAEILEAARSAFGAV